MRYLVIFMYQQYLILFAEITRNKKSQFCAYDEVFCIETPQEGTWIVSVNLLSFEDKIPSKVAHCLFSCSLQSFQLKGPELKIEGKNIILKTAIREPKGFIAFKNLVTNLCFQAKEWRETLRELSRQSPSKREEEALFFA
jgi:hypothetical protein